MNKQRRDKVLQWLLDEGREYIAGYSQDYGPEGGLVGFRVFGLRIGPVKVELNPNGSIDVGVFLRREIDPIFWLVNTGGIYRSDAPTEVEKAVAERLNNFRSRVMQAEYQQALQLSQQDRA